MATKNTDEEIQALINEVSSPGDLYIALLANKKDYAAATISSFCGAIARPGYRSDQRITRWVTLYRVNCDCHGPEIMTRREWEKDRRLSQRIGEHQNRYEIRRPGLPWREA